MAYAISNSQTMISWLNDNLGPSYPFDEVGSQVPVKELDSFLARMHFLMKSLVITDLANEAVSKMITWRVELEPFLNPDAPPSFVSADSLAMHKQRLMILRDQLVKDHETSAALARDNCPFATGQEPTANPEVTGAAWGTSKRDKERDERILTKRQLMIADMGRDEAKPLKGSKKGKRFFEKEAPCFRR
jgi:hypothetical protein